MLVLRGMCHQIVMAPSQGHGEFFHVETLENDE